MFAIEIYWSILRLARHPIFFPRALVANPSGGCFPEHRWRRLATDPTGAGLCRFESEDCRSWFVTHSVLFWTLASAVDFLDSLGFIDWVWPWIISVPHPVVDIICWSPSECSPLDICSTEHQNGYTRLKSDSPRVEGPFSLTFSIGFQLDVVSI